LLGLTILFCFFPFNAGLTDRSSAFKVVEDKSGEAEEPRVEANGLEEGADWVEVNEPGSEASGVEEGADWVEESVKELETKGFEADSN